MEKKEKFNIETIKKKALQQVISGKSLFDKDGALAPMVRNMVAKAIDGKSEIYSYEEESEGRNSKNGKTSKRVKATLIIKR